MRVRFGRIQGHCGAGTRVRSAQSDVLAAVINSGVCETRVMHNAK